MSRTMRRLQRLVVVGASTAAIAGGIVPLASGVANAAAGTDTATAIAISPHSTTGTVNTCTPYTVTVSPDTGSFDVQISEPAASSGTTTIGFCDVSGFNSTTYPNPQKTPGTVYYQDNAGNTQSQAGPNCPDATSGTARCDAVFTAVKGKVTFGVTSNQPGQMTIVAYNDINGNHAYEPGIDSPSDTATEQWVANTAANVNCTQPQPNPANTGDTVNWTCNVTTSGGSGVNNIPVRYTVTAGPDKGTNGACTYDTSNTTGSANGQYGNYNCSLTNNGKAGQDTILVYADQNNNGAYDPNQGEPARNNLTATFIAPAATGSTVTVTCTTNQSNTAGTSCQDPTSDKTETFTATVNNSSANGGATESGVLVTFSKSGNAAGKSSLNPTTCVTDNTGSCSTVLTNSSPAEGDNVTVTATVNTAAGPGGVPAASTASNSATKYWHNPNSDEARNITVMPQSSTQPAGGTQDFVATVTDRFGNPVPNACVGWTESGPGHITSSNTLYCYPQTAGSTSSTGQYDYTCLTNAKGQCTMTVQSSANESGTETVTADLANTGNSYSYWNGTGNVAYYECSQPAGSTAASPGSGENPGAGAATGTTPYNTYAAPGAPAGNCTATGQVTWEQPAPGPGPQGISVTASPNPGTVGQVETATATVTNADGTPAQAGETVSFTVTGANAASGTAPTNSNGVATFSYTPQNPGQDTITVSVPNASGPSSTSSTTVTINQTPPPPPPPPPHHYVIHPKIRVSSTKGHVHVVVYGPKKDNGANVTFVAHVNGRSKTVGSDNLRNGEASLTFKAARHALVTVHAVVGANSNRYGTWSKGKTKSKTVTVK